MQTFTTSSGTSSCVAQPGETSLDNSFKSVIRTILSKSKKGTGVVYIPGNHVEFFRDYDGMRFFNVVIRTFDIHTTANGKQYLIMHGDEFDSAVKCNRLLSFIGSRAYDEILEINRSYNYLRRTLGLP